MKATDGKLRQTDTLHTKGIFKIIESTYVHDFKWCSCKTIVVDGGHEYLRRIVSFLHTFHYTIPIRTNVWYNV